jgi:hypothetical protein
MTPPDSRRSLVARLFAIAMLGAVAAQCGGGGGSPAGPTPPGGGGGGGGSTASATITITASGVDPKSVTIPQGGRVLFVNSSGATRNVSSDAHPLHTDCPEINQVGTLANGQQRETGNFVRAQRCGFHDHDRPTNASLQGTIVVQ